MKEINMKNANAIEMLTKAIKEEEGRATARTITAEEVVDELERIETRLGIAKKALNGVRVLVDMNAQSFPNAYKYTPESTHFEATFKNGSWRVTNIYRLRCCSPNKRVEVAHTEESRKAVIERMTCWG